MDSFVARSRERLAAAGNETQLFHSVRITRQSLEL